MEGRNTQAPKLGRESGRPLMDGVLRLYCGCLPYTDTYTYVKTYVRTYTATYTYVQTYVRTYMPSKGTVAFPSTHGPQRES